MSTRHTDNDGSDIFWPGYVDAVTNLVLNLLFLLTIMTVAVFMFALELGRASKGGTEQKPNPAVSAKKESNAALKGNPDTIKENVALKKEIQRLNSLLAMQDLHKTPPNKGLEKSVEVSTVITQQSKLDKTVANDLEVTIRFKDEAVSFSPQEHEKVRELLKQISAKGKTAIYVEVPAGFTESKRMGLYRALAVRNVLLEMKVPKEQIDVSVREGKNNPNASVVKVRGR